MTPNKKFIRNSKLVSDKPSNIVFAYKFFEDGSKFGKSCIFFRCDFGDDCSFGDDCEFTDYTTFGNKCSFGEGCIFGNCCNFGDDCEFSFNCKFGNKPLFGKNCNAINDKIVNKKNLIFEK